MRPIDANELKSWLNGFIETDNISPKYMRTLIDDAPTVDAIPVEWILHYVDIYYDVDNYDDIWRYIMKMHDKWEKENEANAKR